MVTKRQKIKVGIFVFVCFTLLIGSLIIVSGFRSEKTEKYSLIFSVSVSGLGPGSDVRYLGVPIGKVTDIFINDANKIQVSIEVFSSRITLYKGVVAQLGMQGITGLSFISITGGEMQNGKLVSGSFIETKASILTTVIDQVPYFLEEIKDILKKINVALTLVNQQDIDKLLTNVSDLLTDTRSTVNNLNQQFAVTLKSFSDTSASLKANIETLTSKTGTTLTALDSTLDINGKALKNLLGRTDYFINNLTAKVDQVDIKGINHNTINTLAKVATLSRNIDGLISQVKSEYPNMNTGLERVEYDLHQTLTNLNKTLESVKVLFDAFEQKPNRILVGNE